MTALAVDIVLLPPEKISEFAIEQNKALLKQQPSTYVLGKKHCLPHLSLAMGHLDEKDKMKIQEILTWVAKEQHELQLTIEKTYCASFGEYAVSGLEINLTAHLKLLQETIMHRTKELLKEKRQALFVGAVNEATQRYCREYLAKKMRSNFHPHITVGIGEAKALGAQISFVANRLALCQLGDFCTCRRILFEIELATPARRASS